MMAAEAGIEVGTFNLAWLCEENKVITYFFKVGFYACVFITRNGVINKNIFLVVC